MTVNEMYLRALTLLGYVNYDGEISNEYELKRQAIAAINQVYAELYFAMGKQDFNVVSSSADVIDLPERILYDVMPYGVAMFIAQNQNDGDSQALFAHIYNKKRASIRKENYVQDVLPRGSDF